MPRDNSGQSGAKVERLQRTSTLLLAALSMGISMLRFWAVCLWPKLVLILVLPHWATGMLSIGLVARAERQRTQGCDKHKRRSLIRAFAYTCACLSFFVILPVYFVPHAFSAIVLFGLTAAIVAILLLLLSRSSVFAFVNVAIVAGILLVMGLGVWQERREYALWIAIVKGDVAEIQALISKGYDVTGYSDLGTPLTATFCYGYMTGRYYHWPKQKKLSKEEMEGTGGRFCASCK
jgi:hypothetical protein